MAVIWYVLFCPLKNEEEIIRSCRAHLPPEVLEDAFLFTYDRMKRYQGDWHTRACPMFPGYVFLESRESIRLSKELDQYRRVGKVLGSQGMLLPVDPVEEAFLNALCGKSRHMGMSRGYIRNGITHIYEGPLTGREQLISRIDRHKRLARLKASVFQKPGEIYAGLEIVEKS